MPIDQDELTPLGFLPADAIDMARGKHEAVIAYADGAPSRVTLDVDIDGLYFVTSRNNPDAPYDGTACKDRVEIEAMLYLASQDGRLDELWTDSLVATNAEVVKLSTSFSILAAASIVGVELGPELRGAYAPNPAAEICVPLTSLSLELTRDGLRGRLDDTWVFDACTHIDDGSAATGRAGAVFDAACSATPASCCCRQLTDRGVFGEPPLCQDDSWTCGTADTVACGEPCAARD